MQPVRSVVYHVWRYKRVLCVCVCVSSWLSCIIHWRPPGHPSISQLLCALPTCSLCSFANPARRKGSIGGLEGVHAPMTKLPTHSPALALTITTIQRELQWTRGTAAVSGRHKTQTRVLPVYRLTMVVHVFTVTDSTDNVNSATVFNCSIPPDEPPTAPLAPSRATPAKAHRIIV